MRPLIFQPKIIQKIALIHCLSMSCVFLFAQNDSLTLRVERLAEGDILTKKEVQKGTIVQSSTRSEVDIYNQSNTVFVVSSDDILKNGWNTLGEVLRHVPGIQVSQPGSAFEGDVFMMRGFRGNSEATILINDVPIRPSAVVGMPLGAQLPIRQAERIEILFGGGGGFFGENEAGGIINIILKETERPIFTQADLSFGKNNYNSLDLFFGGKIGRDKNIFRFGIYGSSTVLGDRALYHADEKESLFDAKNYLLPWQDSLFYQIPENFSGRIETDSSNQPQESSQAILSKTPTESRLFGVNLRWHGVHFTYNRMYRRDHASLGLSPLAVNYANSQNYIGEQIETFSLGARRVRERGSFFYTLSSVFYRMDDRSTTAWVMPMVGAAYFAHADSTHALTGDTLASKLIELDLLFFGGQRYSMATSTDFRQEIRWNRRINDHFRFQFGQTANFKRSKPLAHFSRESGQNFGLWRNRSSFSSPVFGERLLFLGSLAHSLEGVFTIPKGQISAGGVVRLEGQRLFEGRAMGFYNLNSWLQFRGNAVSRRHFAPEIQTVQTIVYAQETDFFRDVYAVDDRKTAKTNALELGLRFRKFKQFSLDASVFLQKTKQISANGYFYQQSSFIDFLGDKYGYLTDPNALRTVSGFLIFGKTMPLSIGFSILKKEIQFDWTHQFSLAVQKGKLRAPAQTTAQNRVPGLSSALFKYQTTFSWPKTQILVHFNFVGATPNWEGFWKNQWQRPVQTTENAAYSTVDLVFRRTLSSNFQVYFFVNNVFNRHFAGLDATGSPDDLRFNPQSGRVVRLGINYNMN
jgi:TonB-dependent Receptor Plug Domain